MIAAIYARKSTKQDDVAEEEHEADGDGEDDDAIDGAAAPGRSLPASPRPRLVRRRGRPDRVAVCYRGTDDTVAMTWESFSRFVKTGFS